MLISVALLALMAAADHATFRTWLTPVTILGGPYMGLAVIAFLIGPSLGFVPLYTPSVLLWTGLVAIFWIPGRLLSGAAGTWKSAPGEWSAQEEHIQRLVLTFGLLTIPISLYAAWAAGAASGGLADYRDTEYQKISNGGFAGHVLTLAIPVIIYLIGTTSKRRALNGIVGGAILLSMFLRPSKGWIILTIISVVFYRVITRRMKVRVRLILGVVVALFSVFSVAYLINFSATDPSLAFDPDTYTFLWRHILDYSFSGVMGFSEVLREGAHCLNKPAEVFAPFMNIYSLLSGGQLANPIEEGETVIRVTEGWGTNVYTLFGTTLRAVGYFQTVLYTMGLGIISYAVFLIGRRAAVWPLILWCFWAAALSCAWFDTYFATLPLLEIPGYCLTLHFLNRTAHERLNYHARPL